MFDLIVIGGGVNGSGIARDAAMRGLSVVLLEREDFGVGASGNSSWMVHGGVRYLFSDPTVTRDSCRDSGYIQKIASHLIFRIPFLMPTVGGRPGGHLMDRGYLYGVESFLGVYDRYQPLKHGKQSVRLSAKEAYDIEPGLRRDIVGAATLDEYGIDAFRLCVLNGLAACEKGADIRTWTEVERLLRDGSGRVRGVLARDRLTGDVEEIEGKVTVNAAGAWSPRLAGRNGLSVKMRPGKGIHVVLDRKISNYGIISQAVDGRDVFIIPLETSSVIGTTDDDFYGDPGQIEVTNDEVSYLLEAIEHLLPEIRKARVIRTYAGVRPTLYEYGRNESDLSRDHAIVDHAAEGAPGMLSMVGGKLAAYRMMSEEAVDLVEDALGRPRSKCRTALEPLPGGAPPLPDPALLSEKYETPPWETERLVHRQGSRAEDVLVLTKDEPALRAPVCQCEGVLGAELVWCMRNEHVRRLSDLMRRCRLGHGPCGGTRCARTAATIFARERGLDAEAAMAELVDFLEGLWRFRRPALDGHQLAQEELARGIWLSSAGLDEPARGGCR